MRTKEERVSALHRRAREIQKKDAQRVLRLSAATSVFLLLVLTSAFVTWHSPLHNTGSAWYAGSSLLSEDAGAYVLVAVIAFAAGVVLTAVLRYTMKKEHEEDKDNHNAKE